MKSLNEENARQGDKSFYGCLLGSCSGRYRGQMTFKLGLN